MSQPIPVTSLRAMVAGSAPAIGRAGGNRRVDAAWYICGFHKRKRCRAESRDPTRRQQRGIVSGTLHNIDTDQCRTVQGQGDKDTQRVAFRIGESDSIVAETGLYNLTQEEAPLLIHFGTERTENYLLVRFECAEDDE